MTFPSNVYPLCDILRTLFQTWRLFIKICSQFVVLQKMFLAVFDLLTVVADFLIVFSVNPLFILCFFQFCFHAPCEFSDFLWSTNWLLSTLSAVLTFKKCFSHFVDFQRLSHRFSSFSFVIFCTFGEIWFFFLSFPLFECFLSFLWDLVSFH